MELEGPATVTAEIYHWLCSDQLTNQLCAIEKNDQITWKIDELAQIVLEKMTRIEKNTQLFNELAAQIGFQGRNFSEGKIAYDNLSKIFGLMYLSRSIPARNCSQILNPLLRQAWVDFTTEFSRFGSGNITCEPPNDLISNSIGFMETRTLQSLACTSNSMYNLVKQEQIRRKTPSAMTLKEAEIYFGNFAAQVRVLNLIEVGKSDVDVLGTIFSNLLNLTLKSDLLKNVGLEGLRWLPGLKRLALNCGDLMDKGLSPVKRLLELKNLDLRACNEVSNHGLNFLNEMTHLESLGLQGNRITEKVLYNLRDLTGLRRLQIGLNLITDKGLSHLKNLTNLEVFQSVQYYGASNHITDDGLIHLKGLTELRDLYLPNSRIKGSGLYYLAKMKKLNRLDLAEGCDNLTGAGLVHLASLQQLQYLNLYFCENLRGEGLQNLSKLSKLQILNLTNCSKISDTEIDYFTNLSNLEVVCLGNCPNLTDVALQSLSHLPNLKILFLNGCSKLSDKGLINLTQLTKLQDLVLNNCRKISDHGLKHLRGMSNLEKIYLSTSSSIVEGALELKELGKEVNLEEVGYLWYFWTLMTPKFD
jgi:hypothetical protein